MSDATLPLLNRELSRLDYNARVVERAADSSLPLLERLRFLTYGSRNLDEFFMVRVGTIRDLLDAGVSDRSPDGLTPAEQMSAIRARARSLLESLYDTLNRSLLPELATAGVRVEPYGDLSEEERHGLRTRFLGEIAPVLTPLAIDPAHPFPFVANLALNLALVVQSERSGEHVVLLKLPQTLPRFVPLRGGGRFVPIESLILENVDHFFPAMTIREAALFRVIRNTELTLDDDEVEDLRESIEAELRRRERKQVVCLEIDGRAGTELASALARGTRTPMEDVYGVTGFLKPSDLAEICDAVTDPALHFAAFQPRMPHRLSAAPDPFAAIRGGDVLLHRPYDSFNAIVEFLEAAALDPHVVAIKQTLYQTDEHSPIVDQLVLAALNGKEVSVVIELQARFEEKKNIALAARLQDAGAQVVYGIVGLQTHVKISLVIRSEGDALRRYVHLSTGNYNAETARTYSDLDLLTCDAEIGRDTAQLFNVLTGYSVHTLPKQIGWERFIVAPFEYHRWLLGAIRGEADHARAGRPAGITAKLNSLVDPAVIAELYAASAAGVKVDLVVRSMCCLVPGLPQVSDRIRVTSIIDRFLEHGRILRFENGGQPVVYLSSGDWMPRNFQRRVEVTFPLLDALVRERAEGILARALADSVSSWELMPDGSWAPRRGSGPSSQEIFVGVPAPAEKPAPKRRKNRAKSR